MSTLIKNSIISALSAGRTPGVEAPANERIPESAMPNSNVPISKDRLDNEVRLRKHEVQEKYNPAVNY